VKLFLSLIIFIVSFPTLLMSLSIQANINRKSISIQEQIILTVIVSGQSSNLPEPRMPSMPQFNVHSAGRSQNFSFVNGKVRSSSRYTYVLVPRTIGISSIPPITVTTNGKKSQSKPIAIVVTREPQPSQSNQGRSKSSLTQQDSQYAPDIFATVEVDKKKPYVGEQVILIIRLYSAVTLIGNADWIPKNMKGFLSEELSPGKVQNTTYKGRQYTVHDNRIALFPIQPGKISIDPGLIQIRVSRSSTADPFAPDFFRQLFSQGSSTSQLKRLNLKPINFQVKSLPEKNKPPGFSGAVGKYIILSRVDNKNVTVGEAVNLIVTIAGLGNLKTLGVPKITQFRVYETVSTLTHQRKIEGLLGKKRI